MPTVMQDGPYSFVFFNSDRGEPAHIHVKRDRQVAKFWLTLIRESISIPLTVFVSIARFTHWFGATKTAGIPSTL